MSGPMSLEFLSVTPRPSGGGPKPLTDGPGQGKAFADQLRDAKTSGEKPSKTSNGGRDTDASGNETTDIGAADTRASARDDRNATEATETSVAKTSNEADRKDANQAAIAGERPSGDGAPTSGLLRGETPAGAAPSAPGEATQQLGSAAAQPDRAIQAGGRGEAAAEAAIADRHARINGRPKAETAHAQDVRHPASSSALALDTSETAQAAANRESGKLAQDKAAPDTGAADTLPTRAGDNRGDSLIRMETPRPGELAAQADAQRTVGPGATPDATAGDVANRAAASGTEGLRLGDGAPLTVATPASTPTAQGAAISTALAAGAPTPGAQAHVTATPGDLPALVQQTLAAGEDRPDRIVVQLDPPELGRVSIDFKFDAQGLQHITITGENPDAMRQLRSLHFELIQALERNGLSGQDMSFHQEGQAGSGRDEAALARLKAGLVNQGEGQGPELAAAVPQAGRAPLGLTSSGGLDLRL